MAPKDQWSHPDPATSQGESAGSSSSALAASCSQQGPATNFTWVFVFFELVLSASSVSEATLSRWRLVLFRGDEASSFTFCSGKAHKEDQAKRRCPISL